MKIKFFSDIKFIQTNFENLDHKQRNAYFLLMKLKLLKDHLTIIGFMKGNFFQKYDR